MFFFEMVPTSMLKPRKLLSTRLGCAVCLLIVFHLASLFFYCLFYLLGVYHFYLFLFVVQKKHREAEEVLRAHGAKESTKKATKTSTAGLQLMTFNDKIPPQFEYKPISMLERHAITQVRGELGR